MFSFYLFSEEEFTQYIKTDCSHRSSLTWKSVVQAPETDTVNFCEDIYEQNCPLVVKSTEHKEKQRQIAKTPTADEDAQKTQDPTAATRKWMHHP